MAQSRGKDVEDKATDTSVQRARVQRRDVGPVGRPGRAAHLRTADGAVDNSRHRRGPRAEANVGVTLEAAAACPAPGLAVVGLDVVDGDVVVRGDQLAVLAGLHLVAEARPIGVLLGRQVGDGPLGAAHGLLGHERRA